MCWCCWRCLAGCWRCAWAGRRRWTTGERQPTTYDRRDIVIVRKAHRRKLMVFLRVAVSAALLAYVLLRADLRSFVARWPGISQPLLALALLLQLAGVFISSLKWWLLLRAA